MSIINVKEKNMSNVIEIEESYYLDNNYTNILKKIKEENFEFAKDITEEDTYFTDKDFNFIKDRVCLRTRKVNEDFLEITYKPKTDKITEKYGKREVNLKIDPDDYNDAKYIIQELGYIKYVSFKKHRKIYSKTINRFKYSVMIDSIENIGDFIELEILADNEAEKELLQEELYKFIEKMECSNLRQKTKPYRDIVKEYLEKLEDN